MNGIPSRNRGVSDTDSLSLAWISRGEGSNVAAREVDSGGRQSRDNRFNGSGHGSRILSTIVAANQKVTRMERMGEADPPEVRRGQRAISTGNISGGAKFRKLRRD